MKGPRQAVSMLLVVAAMGASPTSAQSAPLRSEYLFTNPPFASAHASTIAETPYGLVTAWFGGSREGTEDVAIWLVRQVNGRWTVIQPRDRLLHMTFTRNRRWIRHVVLNPAALPGDP